jgi:hypothetical protein
MIVQQLLAKYRELRKRLIGERAELSTPVKSSVAVTSKLFWDMLELVRATIRRWDFVPSMALEPLMRRALLSSLRGEWKIEFDVALNRAGGLRIARVFVSSFGSGEEDVSVMWDETRVYRPPPHPTLTPHVHRASRWFAQELLRPVAATRCEGMPDFPRRMAEDQAFAGTVRRLYRAGTDAPHLVTCVESETLEMFLADAWLSLHDPGYLASKFGLGAEPASHELDEDAVLRAVAAAKIVCAYLPDRFVATYCPDPSDTTHVRRYEFPEHERPRCVSDLTVDRVGSGHSFGLPLVAMPALDEAAVAATFERYVWLREIGCRFCCPNVYERRSDAIAALFRFQQLTRAETC